MASRVATSRRRQTGHEQLAPPVTYLLTLTFDGVLGYLG